MVGGMQTHVAAQVVQARADRDKILIGEQIKVKLTVQTPRPLSTWFRFPDSLNHFLVTGRSKIDTVRTGRFLNYNQTISITSFDSGRWEFPSLAIATIQQPTPPIAIDVLPVDVSKLEDYHDIKEIEEVKQENNTVIIAIIAALTLLSIILSYILIRRKKRLLAQPGAVKGNLTPLQWALAELDKLQQQALYNKSQVKKHFSELTNVSRKFFHLELHQPALHQTTDELMVKLQSLPVDNDAKISFIQLLRLADTVKFAKYLPPVDESERSIETTKRMLHIVAELQLNTHSKYQPAK
jgi:hypothetical protein